MGKDMMGRDIVVQDDTADRFNRSSVMTCNLLCPDVRFAAMQKTPGAAPVLSRDNRCTSKTPLIGDD
jgi:hypothetical protein